jgi:hypothetical protein
MTSPTDDTSTSSSSTSNPDLTAFPAKGTFVSQSHRRSIRVAVLQRRLWHQVTSSYTACMETRSGATAECTKIVLMLLLVLMLMLQLHVDMPRVS